MKEKEIWCGISGRLKEGNMFGYGRRKYGRD